MDTQRKQIVKTEFYEVSQVKTHISVSGLKKKTQNVNNA
jgi:hypothetical protein